MVDNILGALFFGWLFKASFLHYLSKKRRNDFVQVGKVTALCIYPVKSCKGISFDSLECTELGTRCGQARDRHWMIVLSEGGSFQSQRQQPKMALVTPSFHGDVLHLDAPGSGTLKIPVDLPVKNIMKTKVFGMPIDSYDCGDEASDWISSHLEKPGKFRIVHHAPELTHRNVLDYDLGESKARPQDQVVFADNFPFLMCSEASVQDVNAHLQHKNKKVTWKNFRPTILIDGTQPFTEDGWDRVKIGTDVTFTAIRHCTRCVMTTVDPEKGVKDADGEPLKTLKSYRIFPGFNYGTSPCFGLSLAVDVGGAVSVGDPVYATTDPTFFARN